MASTTIVTGSGEDESTIEVTLLSPSEYRKGMEPGEVPTALLTARGKDHDMSADQLEKLGTTCLKYAKKLRENY